MKIRNVHHYCSNCLKSKRWSAIAEHSVSEILDIELRAKFGEGRIRCRRDSVEQFQRAH